MKNFWKCLTKRCRGLASKTGRSPYCSKCRSKRWREKHPLTAHYHDLRNRAKQRGKEFSLTIFDYACFWFSSCYAQKHGKAKGSLSINRIDNSKGYVPGNVEALTLSLNARLFHSKMPAWLKEEMRCAELGIPLPDKSAIEKRFFGE